MEEAPCVELTGDLYYLPRCNLMQFALTGTHQLMTLGECCRYLCNLKNTNLVLTNLHKRFQCV